MSRVKLAAAVGRTAGLAATIFVLAALVGGCAHKKPPAAEMVSYAKAPQAAPAPTSAVAPISQPPTNAVPPTIDRSEQIRNACLDGRRMICGRVLEMTNGGLVVDSGYTDLLREPLNRSWVIAANVSATKDPNAIESKVPGSPCIGTVFVTDLPKRGAPPIHKYDYITLLAYPAGQYEYVPVPPITKTIRKFAGTLEMAVALNMRAEQH